MWQILQTQCISRLHCHTCHCSSDHLERLTTFSLEVPERSQHIEVLLANQFGDQPLKEGDDPYRCPSMQSCDNMRANVTKTLIPRQWPQVLILSLKRWRTYKKREVLHTDKISTFIDFEVLLHVPDRLAPYHLRGVIKRHGTTAIATPLKSLFQTKMYA